MQKPNIKLAASVTFALAACISCSHAEKKEPTAPMPPVTASGKSVGTSIEAKQLAAEEQAPFVTELTFRKNDRTLTPKSRTILTSLFDRAKTKGEIQEVRVITWADEEYPSVNTNNLSKKELELAANRNQEIERFLKSIDKKTKVKTYNMAERPGMFADMLSTSDARIKKSLETAGIPNTDTSVKTPAKASKSIVMYILKE